MTYVIARAPQSLLDQATDRWPDRSTASDGTIGDAAHASRASDHNPAPDGKVHAADLTHDPAHGCDGNAVAEAIKDDPRGKYTIWNRRIWNPSISRSWRPYTGTSAHTEHVHESVLDGPLEDSTADWFADLTQGEDFTIMDKATKDYFDNHFASQRQAIRRIRETQLGSIKREAKRDGASADDLQEISDQIEQLNDELRDGD